MFDGVQKWALLYLLLGLLLSFLIANSYNETMDAYETGQYGNIDPKTMYLLNIGEESNEMVIARNKLVYSILLTMYLFGQMLIVKTKI